jgi:hypothetical protein
MKATIFGFFGGRQVEGGSGAKVVGGAGNLVDVGAVQGNMLVVVVHYLLRVIEAAMLCRGQ